MPFVYRARAAALLITVTLAILGRPAAAETLRLAFVGDIMLDGGPGHIVTNGGDPFAPVAPYLLNADLSVGNLECAITRVGHAVDKPYTFKGPVDSLPLLKKYFSVLSLANNHAADFGTLGFQDELALLSAHQIDWVGGGRNEAEARAPYLVSKKGHLIAILAYNEFPPRSFAATQKKPGTAWLVEKDALSDIRRVRATKNPDLVIVYLHWGQELEPLPTGDQIELAHRLIDAGADVLVGSHPHVTQSIEWYHDKPIIYSLGNFVFDYFPWDPPLWTSYILQLEYSDGKRPNLVTVPIELDAAGVPRLSGATKPKN
jgi:poly-gamma-glutamate synthesis protein (capsule biosynthesis protein)